MMVPVRAWSVRAAARLALGALLVSASVFAGVGCKPDLIPGTQVEDTPENREVLDFLGRYRKAIVDRSAGDVVALCAPDYYEDNATVETTDDYGANQLREKLEAHFQKAKEIQLEIVVQAIERPKDGEVHVAYRYNERALVTLPAGDKWITATDVNKLVLREGEEEGAFTVVTGL